VLHGAEATLRRWLPALLIEVEQRHQEADIRLALGDLESLGYEGYALYPDGLRPLRCFDLDRDQLAFLGDGFMAFGVPAGYVNEFLFVRPGSDLSPLAVQP
jgi:hypothetical protein